VATAKRAVAKRTVSPRAKHVPASDAVVVAPRDNKGLMTLARDLRSWTDFVLGIANTAADLSFRVATSRLKNPAQRAAVEKAGGLFRDLRESAGLTLGDLGRAINLKDTSLLEQVEGGKVGLPFEIILRLAGVLGRNDPIPVAMKLTRTYNPKLWATLESLGLGKLAVQAGREREFANLYRASDAARQLNDEEFAAALKFVRAAFEAALVFRAETVKAGKTAAVKKTDAT
jgi:transcriptional regulator with XRE-family HTH domain